MKTFKLDSDEGRRWFAVGWKRALNDRVDKLARMWIPWPWRRSRERLTNFEARYCKRRWAAARREQSGASEQEPTQSGSRAAHGSPALPCVERPTRAGWWVAWNAQNGYPTIYYVCDRLLRATGELFVWLDADWRDPLEVLAAGWSGPLESPKAFKATTPGNGELNGTGEGRA